MDFYSQYAARVAEERKRLKLSQEIAGSVCGVSREMWGKYEKGAAMGPDVLAKFAEAGGDALYILSRLRNAQSATTPQEGSILRAFRLLPPEVQIDIARLVITLAGPKYFEVKEEEKP